MGTSKSKPTPRGNDWRPLKSDITSNFSGSRSVSPEKIVSGAVSASRVFSGVSGSGVGGQGGKGGKSGGTRGKRIGGVVSGLGGFGSTLQSAGLSEALDKIGLPNLDGKPATEVVSIIAEHLSSTSKGLEAEVLNQALQDTILEASRLQNEGTYNDLEKNLQEFINEEGIQGLIESFLAKYVFDATWINLEEHSMKKAKNDSQFRAFVSAYKNVCKEKVSETIKDMTKTVQFGSINWFGKKGISLANTIIAQINSALKSFSE